MDILDYRKMRVFFDYQAFEFQSIGGVSRSYAELINSLQNESVKCILGVQESNNVYLKSEGLHLKKDIKPLYYSHNHWFEGKKYFKGQRTLTRKVMSLFGHEDDCRQMNREYCVRLLKKGKFDIFEPTFFDSYFLPYLKGKPFVITVHDMIPELFPEYFDRDNSQIINKKILCPLAAHIHVPSENTKRDLIQILNIDSSKITVIPHGAPMLQDQNWTPLFDFPYLLYVGDRFGYKNFVPFLSQCANVIKDFSIKLVCTGKPFNQEEQVLINDLGISEKVVHFFAQENQFPSLYHNAVAFVYPSLYEGFGIPILEAYAQQCPVMLNETSCFPEIAGDAAIYFNLKDGKSDFYEKFEYLYKLSNEERKILIEKGTKRLEMYSWQKSAHQLANVYRKIL